MVLAFTYSFAGAMLLQPRLGPSSVRTVTSFQHLARGGTQFAHVGPVMCAEGEGVLEQASDMCDRLMLMLGDDDTPPAALATLKEAISEGDLPKVRVAQFALLVEQTLEFDMSDDGKLSRTTLDVTNKDDEQVVGKMRYLYTYGIKMFKAGMLPQADLESIVLEKLAKRVGLDGAAFDQWLEVPAAV